MSLLIFAFYSPKGILAGLMAIVKLMASTLTKHAFQRNNELNTNDLFGMQARIVGYEKVYAATRSSQKFKQAAVIVGPRPNYHVGAAPVRQRCIVIGA
jgi:hypothetical protein